MGKRSTAWVAAIMVAGGVVCLGVSARACSRVLWADNGQAVVVGRNMDWFNPMLEELWLLPRGVQRDGMTGSSTLTWTAKYGSVIANVAAPSDGMNEKGLAAHMLWLAEADYGKRDRSVPGLTVCYWLQYYLDNFATVKEAVAFTQKTPFQLVSATFDGKSVTCHLALEDASGDSAVIEYIDGTPTIHHGREYSVMTNSPPYGQQVEQLKAYEGFGGGKPLPGSTEAADRFVRGAYYLKCLPEPTNYRECVASILSVMRNMAQPFGTPDPNRPNISATRWRTIADLTNLTYYFESSLNPNIVWVNLKDLNFAEAAPFQKLDLSKDRDSHIGDCSKQFQPAEPFVVPPPDSE